MDDVHNGFADYLERIAVPENQMIIPDEDAQEMWTYDFDVYMNGEKLPPFIEGEYERNRQIYAAMVEKENIVSAVKEDISTYHNADSIATTVFEISESYNGTPVAGEPYYLYLDENYEDYEWQNWKKEYNSYQNTMYSLTHGLAQNVEDYLLNVVSDTLVVAQRERALANVKLVSLFKTEEQKEVTEEAPVAQPDEELSYQEQLFERVNEEYNTFISKIRQESADVLIQSAAEIVDKDRIRLYLEEYTPELTDEQYKALLSRENQRRPHGRCCGRQEPLLLCRRRPGRHAPCRRRPAPGRGDAGPAPQGLRRSHPFGCGAHVPPPGGLRQLQPRHRRPGRRLAGAERVSCREGAAGGSLSKNSSLRMCELLYQSVIEYSVAAK